VTLEQLRELKVGDEFLDSAGKYIGTITYKRGETLNWIWRSLETGKLFMPGHTASRKISELEDQQWKTLTPLLKELL
jgi:hypothetical protein